jgi:hypothetical protein
MSEAVFRQAYAWSEPNFRYTATFVEHSLIIVNRTKNPVWVLFNMSILAFSFWTARMMISSLRDLLFP